MSQVMCFSAFLCGTPKLSIELANTMKMHGEQPKPWPTAALRSPSSQCSGSPGPALEFADRGMTTLDRA